MMPNWNENIVEIHGTREDIDTFMELAESNEAKEFRMDSVIPEPKKENGEPSENWYGWRSDHWGCKWDVNEVQRNDSTSRKDKVDRHYTELSYNTPWCPNIEFFVSASKMFPELYFQISYCEMGMYFIGFAYIKNGEIVLEDHIDNPPHQEMFALLEQYGFYWNTHFVRELIEEEEEEESEETTDFMVV